jgi:hypothetical protein
MCDAQVQHEAALTRWRVVLAHLAYAASLLLGLVMSLFAGYIVVRVALHLFVGLFLTALIPTLAVQLRRSTVGSVIPAPRALCCARRFATLISLLPCCFSCRWRPLHLCLPLVLCWTAARWCTLYPPSCWVSMPCLVRPTQSKFSFLWYLFTSHSLPVGALRAGPTPSCGRQNLDGWRGGQHGCNGPHGVIIPRGNLLLHNTCDFLHKCACTWSKRALSLGVTLGGGSAGPVAP